MTKGLSKSGFWMLCLGWPGLAAPVSGLYRLQTVNWESPSQVREPVPAHLFTPFEPPPALAPVPPQAVLARPTRTLTNLVGDPDARVQTLIFRLPAGPPVAGLNASKGVFSGGPTIARAGSGYPVSLAVIHSGLPPLAATQALTFTVLQPTSLIPTPVGLGSG